MIEKVMKVVKNSNKKRSRNITTGAVIGFLLSCTAVMGTDNYLWIKENNGTIEFNTAETSDKEGTDGNWNGKNPYEENNWNVATKTYTNNTTLSSNDNNGKGIYQDREVDISYGLKLSGDLTGVNFINNGSITGIMSTASGDGNGYGIYNTGTMGDITNGGLISGNGDGFYAPDGNGYGIGIYNVGEIGDVTNIGIISGSGDGSYESHSYGIYNRGKIGDITNIGIISANGPNHNIGISYSGIGIFNIIGATMENITNIGIISSSIDGILNAGKIGDITNIGIISGSGENYGFGITASVKGTIENIKNIGLINGSGTNKNPVYHSSGIQNIDQEIGYIINIGLLNGIYNLKKMKNITNIGITSGSGYNLGHGIYNSYEIGNITNTGIIRGYIQTPFGYDSGYGINNESGTIGDITNTGVIYGKDSAIKNDTLISNVGTIKEANNYGILINGNGGKEVVDGLEIETSAGENKLVNYGLIIKNEGKNQGDITAGAAGDQDISFYDNEKNIMGERKITIENVTGKNDDKSNSFDGDKKDHILNALTNTYKVTGENNNVTGSIINAYGTAVVFGDTGDNNQLTLSGTIVNGGIDESDPNTKGIAISGSNNGDTLILQSGEIKYKDNNGEEKSATQNTIVNGNIDMGAGDDKLIVGSGTVLNGTVAMGAGDDELEIENGAVINGKLDGGIGTNSTLNFNSTTARTLNSDKINIMYNISNFKNMNINTNVTLFEKTINASGEVADLKVTGAAEIKIGENGTLTLRIDSTNKDNSSGIDKIIGHALYENEGELSSTDGGKLLLALNGAGNESIISFGKTTLGDGLVTGNEGTLDTTSQLHTILKLSENEVKVVIRWDIPEILKYKELNKIYHGILSVEDLIGNFNVDTDEKLSTFLGYLNDIYAGNPYSYSSELSRKSVGMFRDIATENQFKPKLNKWLIMGGLTHVDGGTKDTYYGKGYYTYDIGSSDMDADTKITGAYMLGEYGVSDTLTYGVVIGGNKLKSDLSNGSKVDGDALYMGAYAKKYVGNLKVTGGLGLQYGDYDADRFAAGRGITETRSYSDNYNDMTYDIYLNGRYSHNIGENLFLEPYGTLSYTYIKQDSTDEGNKTLAIETDSKSFDYTAAKVGVDIKKVIPHEKGKSTLSAGVSYTRLLNGADEENITGRFKGKDATDFDILVAHKNEHSIGLNAKYALELENGVLFDVKGSYNVERDSHNGSGKNRTKGEWIVGVGIGYKF
ncbi:autotransporter outer membrane beta-barrel domain-containing protein [Fusobacterium varium]|uniref:autotransporter outer membrane beta-barrel domain-containing protein n=1 Tax=Fusobacterium varium TaxID=856 RepID=UPI000E4F6A3C|nr:autotransporter outer membrane beta-barrel domain-containing protein [Fusobacterium varium]RHG38224.1 autotransporter outer membrane beta-barrel domain-containing protein [Fusobacterium varium]